MERGMTPLTYRDLVSVFHQLPPDREQPVIAHASLSSFGEVQGGAATLLGALLTTYNTLIMPTFTYKTMVIPPVGPPNNGLSYGSAKHKNLMAEFFWPETPSDRLMGVVAEALRQHPDAHRSRHPILSFSGINAEGLLASQTIANPLAPIEGLVEGDGWVLLLGVDHSVNTSIHYGEKLAGRKQFIRWALTPQGVQECPGYPGSSHGFQDIAPRLEDATHRAKAGQAEVQAIPLGDLIATVREWISQDPLALLCERADCQRCSAVRATVNP